MVVKLLPARFKSYLKREHRWLIRDSLPKLAPSLMQFAHLLPHQPSSDSYTLPSNAYQGESLEGVRFIVPPPTLWVSYGRTPEEYLESGKEDVEKMQEIYARSGAPLEAAGRILELGCAGGRMIRWLDNLADSCEIWGADIWATAIIWCQQNLSRPSISSPQPFVPTSRSRIVISAAFTLARSLHISTTWQMHGSSN